MSYTKSIVQPEENPPRCYLTGRRDNLERHHIMAGTANRHLSEKYGLWVWLTHDAHTGAEGAQYNPVLATILKRDAQRAFTAIYGRQMWMRLFRKNYLNDDTDGRETP